ncbi:MAG: VanW family protein [Oscillospiraceae bacterium]
MQRKLFCEISPFTYKISTGKQILIRKLKNLQNKNVFASQISTDRLPVTVYKHNSLIRRKLGIVNLLLQENKAINLSIAAPKINGIIIKPNEIFSFWQLVLRCGVKDGYKEGLIIAGGVPSSGVGGGLCQLTNLIHWLVLHSPLTIIEHHHHDGVDLFPDYNRQVPFGVGTSICYNYLDYRLKNNTDLTYQLVTYVKGQYLCGQLLCDKEQESSYHITVQNEYFYPQDEFFYRHNEVYRKQIDKVTGNCVNDELIMKNNAKVMYDNALIDGEKIRL